MKGHLTLALLCGGLLVACSGGPPTSPDPTPRSATTGSTAPTAEGPRIGASQVLVPDPGGDGVLLVTGPPDGGTDRGPLALWRWDGAAWSPVEAAGEWPVTRTFFAAALDPRRGVLVVHGGEGAPEVQPGETWEWDGHGWSLAGTGPDRSAANLAWDARSGALVLHGGMRGDTWTWDGRGWARADGPGPTPPRWVAAMVEDGSGGVVMYGGHQVDPDHASALADTWVWSDGGWREADADGPGRLVNAAALVHPRHGPLLAGGSDMQGENGDVWRWTGERWEPLARDVLPPRQAMGLAYDGARDVVVLTGGVVEPGSTLRHQDVWEWSGDPGEQAVLVSDRPPA